MTRPPLRFTEADVEAASEAWGCNCGPAALSACLGWTLEQVRPHLGDFDRLGYLNVEGMASAIRSAGARYHDAADPPWAAEGPAWPVHGLVRVQFGGPWTGPGASPRWAAKQTHWVACHRSGERLWHVYDVNSGWVRAEGWAEKVAPWIARSIDRADGTWTMTHRWEVRLPKAGGS